MKIYGKICGVMIAALLAAPIVRANQPAASAEPVIVICVDRAIDPWVLERAQVTASRMFAGIGVFLEWRGTRNCGEGDNIVIKLRSSTPRDYQPGALAEAFPYEKTHIRVFYDRVQSFAEPRMLPQLLAHVLVHEITHMLEGVSRHSDTGVLKAHWDGKDYVAMSSKPLPFAADDIRLIQYGLERRYGWHDKAEGSNRRPPDRHLSRVEPRTWEVNAFRFRIEQAASGS